jgi:hypothetical protein
MPPTILYHQLSPLVFNPASPVAPTFKVKLDSAPTSVGVYLQLTATNISLTPDATGTLFTGTIPTSAFGPLVAAEANRKWIGYINVKTGATTQQWNLFGDVLSPSIPSVTIHSVTADIQRTDHLVNIHWPTLADKFDDIFAHVGDITKAFYAHFDDVYDWIHVITEANHPTDRFGYCTRNTVSGIGLTNFDQNATYGSAGRLTGMVMFPYPTGYDGISPTTFHEIGHRWMVQLSFAPFTAGIPHWPISDLATDIMGYSLLAMNEGGQFSYTITPLPGGDYQLTPNSNPKVFSDLAQYLMGMRSAATVGSHFVFDDQTQALPIGGAAGTLHGPVTNVSASDVVAHFGPRSPDASTAQKCFRVATLLVTRDGLAAANTMKMYDYFASRLSATAPQPYADGFLQGTALPFSTVTGGPGCLHSRIKMNIVVDASRDGGVWWFPQTGPFLPGAPHQGLALAQHLRSLGHTVTELPRPTTITSALLADVDIVIRANGHGAYSAAEIAAYDAWVQAGGNLLLLADHHPNDGLATHFGLTFKGITEGQRQLSTFTVHPVTTGVTPIFYGAGSGILAHPASATIIGKLSAGTFLDLNDDHVKQAGEPSAPAGLGVMPLGKGRIVFCGDTNLWEHVPQPLVKNTLGWFALLS